MLQSMPAEVQALRDSWPSLVDQVKGLTWELEQDFRFGQHITPTDQGYVMGGTIKGGSSSMWYPATEEEYQAYCCWRDMEGVLEKPDPEASAELCRQLKRFGIEITTQRRASPIRRSKDDVKVFSGYGPLYRSISRILPGLPEEHLARPAIDRIQLGGWGPDAAKASAYRQGVVHMYDFACRGAHRTFLGLFLHELGHVHEVSLSEEVKDRIHPPYLVLAEENAFYGVEFLVDANTRKLYQRFVFNEFLAEMYMVYAACGEKLRRHISGQKTAVREAWQTIYELLRDSFYGCEYE